MSKKDKISYKVSGVDINKGDEVNVDTTTNHPMKVKRASKGVSPRKESGVFVADVDLEGGLDTQNVRERVPIAKHDTLWVSSGTRRINK